MKKLTETEKNEVVTKGYLMEVIEEGEIVTKDYLDEVMDKRDLTFTRVMEEMFEKQFERIKAYIDFRLAPLEEMAKDYYKFKDHVMKTLDWLVKSYEEFQESHDYLSGRYGDTQEKLDNHEKRILILEVDKLRKNKTN